MTDMQQDDRLTQLLDELGPAEPPAGFARGVMTRIGGERPTARVLSFGKGGMVMTKKVMLGLAAAAAVILAFFTVHGFPTVDRGTEGTIGAAKKYEAPQIAASDVKTGDASAQDFLQSDTYDKLAKDPAARALLSDPGFVARLHDQKLADALRDQNVRDMLRDPLIARIFSDDALQSELSRALHDELAGNVKGAAAEAALKSNTRAQYSSAVRDVLARENYRSALGHQAIWAALSDANFRQALSHADYAAALNSPAMIAAFSQAGFQAAIQSNAMASALAAH